MRTNFLQYRTTCAALAYAALFMGMLWAAYHNQLPTTVLETIPYYDKVGHVVLYGLASYLGHRVLRRHYRLGGIAWPFFPTAFAVFTLVEEGLQGMSPYRSLDGLDLVCSLVGVSIGYLWAERQRSIPR